MVRIDTKGFKKYIQLDTVVVNTEMESAAKHSDGKCGKGKFS